MEVSCVGVVTLSSKFQVVIPQDVRAKLNLMPGQKIVVVEKDGVVHLIPQRALRDMKGFIKGLDTKDLRDEEDRI
jgi:AbrB family looped-hinge helix DNA binding protein